MTRQIFSDDVKQVLRSAQEAARDGATKRVAVDGQDVEISYPFPSPADWRDTWIYFLMIDRFNNPDEPPNSTKATPPVDWDGRYDFHQGGTFEGVRQQLGYIADLGARAVWLSPVLKNARADWAWNYHGYGAQDFLNVDERFGSDGTRETAERELIALIEEAHARGIYVILDIVLNHSARVFDYLYRGEVRDSFRDSAVMNAGLGQEPAIRWLNGFGIPRDDWQDDLPPPAELSDDDAIWPADLQRREFFRRRGEKLTDDPGDNFVKGDFGVMRQLAVEYDARIPGQEAVRRLYGKRPVLGILIRAYQYLVAKYDFDGFRIDTVKYVDPTAVQIFGNAMREYALSIGKKNFFTFGEIYDNEETIAAFVGRNKGNAEGFGIDAALDFPLFFKLPALAKGQTGVEGIRQVFEERKKAASELLSTHGEAGRFFVTFLDNHDQHQRFKHPQTPPNQVTAAVALLFTLQGIPSLFYGTEQGLDGTKKADGSPDLDSLESVREALWGKEPVAFDRDNDFFKQIKRLSRVRADEPSLRYGRLYFRQLSGNGRDFGHSSGQGGVLAYSRWCAGLFSYPKRTGSAGRGQQ
jgi:glycosidase